MKSIGGHTIDAGENKGGGGVIGKKCFAMEMKREETNVCKTSTMATWGHLELGQGFGLDAAGCPRGQWR